MCSNLACECEISDSNRKKLDESWTRLTFLHLNEWGENCQMFLNTLSKYTIFLNTQFLHFHLIESI